MSFSSPSALISSSNRDYFGPSGLCTGAGKESETLAEVSSFAANDGLDAVADAMPWSSPAPSERRDSGIGDLGINNLATLLDETDAVPPMLEVAEEGRYAAASKRSLPWACQDRHLPQNRVMNVLTVDRCKCVSPQH